MRIAVSGIDLGKNGCSLTEPDDKGAVVKRRCPRPDHISSFTKDSTPCVVALEACCGAPHPGRLLAAQGHEVRLMAPVYVRPYVKAQKSDDRAAEAATRPTVRLVELKDAARFPPPPVRRCPRRRQGRPGQELQVQRLRGRLTR